MIAHTSLPVSDYRRSKAFCIQVLRPLGYTNNMEFDAAAGFNDGKTPTAGLVTGTVAPVHLAFEAGSCEQVKVFHAAALAAGAGIMAPRYRD